MIEDAYICDRRCSKEGICVEAKLTSILFAQYDKESAYPGYRISLSLLRHQLESMDDQTYGMALEWIYCAQPGCKKRSPVSPPCTYRYF